MLHYRNWTAFDPGRYVHYHATVVSWLAIFLAGYLFGYFRALANLGRSVVPVIFGLSLIGVVLFCLSYKANKPGDVY
jgi:hypothetical protein